MVLVNFTGFEVKDHAQKLETPNSLPAPPQMPLPEIPQPWLVSQSPPSQQETAHLGFLWLGAGDESPVLEERRPCLLMAVLSLLSGLVVTPKWQTVNVASLRRLVLL